MMNEGCITNLPYESVVEVPCYVDGNGISIPKTGGSATGMCSSVLTVHLGTETGSRSSCSRRCIFVKTGCLNGSTDRAVCNPPEIWQMIDEMLVAQEEWLPQYKEGIEAAKQT